MQFPEIRPGRIEQALFTWSRLNKTGVSGQSFGSISPGLSASIPWLKSLKPPTFNFQSKDASLAGWDHAHSDWRSFTAVCSATSGSSINVIFRKLAHAGVDGGGRPRSLAHCLIGRSCDLDLASVDPADTRWLNAEDCPLDDLPALETLVTTALMPRDLSHDCSVDDDAAVRLLADLSTARGHLHLERIDIDQLQRLLLLSLPADLWSKISFDSYVSALGATVDIRILDGSVRAGDPSRIERAGLGACVSHLHLEDMWARCVDRTWAAYAVSATKHVAAISSSRDTAPTQTALGNRLDSRDQIVQGARETLDDHTWDFDSADAFDLTDAELRQLLTTLKARTAPSAAWHQTLKPDDLWRVYSGASTVHTFRVVHEFFEFHGFDEAELLRVWRSTGLAVFGFALTQKMHRQEEPPAPGWAVPRLVDREELLKLVLRVAGADVSLSMVGTLLAGGLLDHARTRRPTLRALLDSGISSATIYKTLVVHAGLTPGALFEVIRESPETFAAAVGLPTPYQNALRRGIRTRRTQRLLSMRGRSPQRNRRDLPGFMRNISSWSEDDEDDEDHDHGDQISGH